MIPGDVLKGTFELVEVLGEGGMGTVFKALNLVWQEVEARDPYVAIKILKPELAANKQLVRSLFSDFDRTKTLVDCPNIIKVFGFDRDNHNVYMTMEYLKGATLADKIKQNNMSFVEAWPIINGIGKALIFAHSHNIIHRDIKPSNVMISNDGVVKVLDFGIASKINENEGDETLFSGHSMGALTIAYASPEMQRDYPPDARDDIFAFACVIYEILTGKQFYKQKIRKAGPIPGLNSRQLEILNKGLAFNREDRVSNVQEFLDKLEPKSFNWVNYSIIGVGFLGIAGIIFWLQFSVPANEKPSTTDMLASSSSSLAPPPTELPLGVSSPTHENEANPTLNPNTVATIQAPPLPEQIPVNEQTEVTAEKLTASNTSKDGVIHINTSKSSYKNGEFFRLFFSLTQPGYVRIVDRDAHGELSTLYPNKNQLEKLLNTNRKYSFPPDGFNVPILGPLGKSTLSIVFSKKPFDKGVDILNENGNLTEKIRSGDFSWTQIQYRLN